MHTTDTYTIYVHMYEKSPIQLPSVGLTHAHPNERIQIFHKDWYCEVCEGQWRATVRVKHQGPEWRWLNMKHQWHWFVFLLMMAGHSQAVQV